MIVDFLVLACSMKHNERCVAGFDLTNKELVRLITKNEATKNAIPAQECFYNKIARELKPLDVITIDRSNTKEPKDGAQTENVLVGFPLVKQYIRRASLNELRQITVSTLPFSTKEEYLDLKKYTQMAKSLCLVRAYNVRLYTKTNLDGDSKTKVQFDVYISEGIKETLTDYSVTDTRYYLSGSTNKNKENKTVLGKAYLLISLGPNESSDRFYKFVSGIIDSTNL